MRNHTASGRSSRVVATIVAVATFASFGGIGLANGVIDLAQFQYGKKITICHKNKVTITVSVNAWPAHKRHGDTTGPCVAASSAKADAKPGKGQGGKGQGGKGHGGKGHGKGKGGNASSTGSSGKQNGAGNGKGKSK